MLNFFGVNSFTVQMFLESLFNSVLFKKNLFLLVWLPARKKNTIPFCKKRIFFPCSLTTPSQLHGY